MTNQQNPITPPPELVQHWSATIYQETEDDDLRDLYIAIQAARWGADAELEACVEWLDHNCPSVGGFHLRLDRRPKPLSLKEQALKALKNIDDACESEGFSRSDDTNTIRRALEQLDD